MKKIIGWAAAGVVGLTLLACSGSPSEPEGDKKVASKATTATAASSAAKPDATPSLAYNEPTAKDFTLKVRVTKKESFDTAGCLVHYRVYDLSYDGLTEGLNPEKEYELTYEVVGIEGGATATITFQGGSYGQPEEAFGQISQKTCKKAKPLSVKVTEVNEL